MNEVLQNIIILVIGVIFVGVLASIGAGILNQGESEVSGALDSPVAITATVMPRNATDTGQYYIIWLPNSIEAVNITCNGDFAEIDDFDGASGMGLEFDWYKIGNQYRIEINFDVSPDCPGVDSVRIIDSARNQMVPTTVIPFSRHRNDNLV